MSKTKIIAILGLIASVATVGVDALNGGGFDISVHLNSLLVAFGSLGLFFLRDAIQKILDVIKK